MHAIGWFRTSGPISITEYCRLIQEFTVYLQIQLVGNMKEQVRLRFSMLDDLMLLHNVRNNNPYKNASNWKIIRLNMHIFTKKSFSMRCIKDHLEHLLKLFLKGDFNNLTKSGTLEQGQKKQRLLAEIHKLSCEFKYKLKTIESPRNHFKDQEFYNPDTSSNNSLPEFEIDPVITCKVEPQSNVIETNSTELTSSNIFLIPINAKNEIDDIQLPSHPISESPVIIHTQENLNGHSTKRPRRNQMIRKKLQQKHTHKLKLLERELDLQERQITLEERKLKLEEEKFKLQRLERETKLQLEKQEREKRLELENQERQNKMNLESKEKENCIELSKQQQKIIDYLIDFKANKYE